MERISDKQIGNLEFDNLSGIYCFRKDENNQIKDKAYITTSFKTLIVYSDNLTNYQVYQWDTSDNNERNLNHKFICHFLGELTLRVLLKEGTPYEKEKAKTMWQLYNPQDITPIDLQSRTNDILNQNEQMNYK